MCDLIYQPVGPRLWNRAKLVELGGYDRNFKAGEDAELLARAFRLGVPVRRCAKHVATVRRTSRPRDLIGGREQQTARLDRRSGLVEEHLSGAIESWCDRNGLLIRRDPTAILGAQPDSCGLIEATDWLNKLPREDVIAEMNRLWTRLAPGGWLRLRIPSTDGRAAFQDPGSRSFWNQNLFLYFTSRRFSRTIPDITCRFQGFRLWTALDRDFDEAYDLKYAFADLVALKGQRQPGPVTILTASEVGGDRKTGGGGWNNLHLSACSETAVVTQACQTDRRTSRVPECSPIDFSCWWNRFMHSNTTNEIAVGTAGFLLASIAVDDPALQWLMANWATLAVVTAMTMTVAAVTCVLNPAPSTRMTIGRILASGIFGAVVSVIAGAVHSSGNGPAATAAIVLLCGIGGWVAWLTIIEYALAMRESPSAKQTFITAAWNVILRIFNIPRAPTGDSSQSFSLPRLSPPTPPTVPPAAPDKPKSP